MSDFDPESATRAIDAALGGPGGLGLVFTVFAGVPGVTRTPPRKSMFRADPERVQIGSWRYEVTRDQRIRAGHVVGGIVLAEELLPAAALAPHLARALAEIASSYGPPALPHLTAALEVLAGSG
ncbi:DUF5073 domain-containing protein [Nocardia yunnanensis]|uniref:DUF5073 domain-containing protein n=1 Tax=Nocardia yunnanensis TaxID=2382165 RepID=A0A386ZDA5_9NOCA|nr:DUF5073 family protein [Nocardia yunnanensis]AYF74605.1 DUF5073 domain-containing protein [Nocardia yunnanensis]